ncbi:hypothetical protein Tsp_05094 [Trichinella spiralis]|uniref:hypothetical protein n=1 Tax=Trichinella spiralis TaxID=6334 RepID=UPI0001EFEEED|nr:hypothetical protein Tsp_05094 [Trichinella spiralis]
MMFLDEADKVDDCFSYDLQGEKKLSTRLVYCYMKEATRKRKHEATSPNGSFNEMRERMKFTFNFALLLYGWCRSAAACTISLLIYCLRLLKRSLISAMDDEEHFADDEMEIEVQTPVIKKKKIRVRKSKKKSVENQFRGQSVRLRDNSKTDNVSNMESNQNLSDCEYSQNIQPHRRHSSMKQNSFASEMKSSHRDDALPYLSYQKNDGMGTVIHFCNFFVDTSIT